jgi:polyphenol oxidase
MKKSLTDWRTSSVLSADFSFVPEVPDALQPNATATEEALIQSNVNIMYQSLVRGGTTAETFLGGPYRYGDPRDLYPYKRAGTLELGPHSTVHLWTGQDPPGLLDMGALARSARDPVFFAHHSNIDRLWQVWKDVGPLLGQKREDYSDPDFLNTEFLFYDENKDLRRVKIVDALDTTKLGYVYQAANDAAWIFPNLTKCSKLSFEDFIAQAEHLPAPQKIKGYYHLEAGTPFVLVIDRPDNPHGLEEFLTIDDIELDKSCLAGFDVYVDLLNPNDYTTPSKCAEYNGRFTNIAQGLSSSKSMDWKQSVTRTFVDIQAPTPPSKCVITILPFSRAGGYETIKFKSVSIGF